MGWFEILLIVVFILFPLLEQIASARRKRQNPGGDQPAEYDGGGYPEWEPEPEPRPQPRPRVRPAEEEAIFSQGWGEWPGARAEPEPVAVEESAPAPRHRWDPGWIEAEAAEEEVARPLPTLRLPEPVAVRVVSLEETSIDRAREHRRFQDRVALPPPAGAYHRPVSPVAAALHRRDGVRDAILLAEVLGPPRSLRPLEAPQT